MIRKIENDKLCVQVSDHGAELISIFDKANNREVVWQADPTFWNRHAPILFPYVGRHFKKEYRVNGKTYPALTQHGFARNLEFNCESVTEDTITHVLKSTEKTMEIYPFAFTLKVTQSIKGGTLTVKWNVYNENDETMYFTIGGHPAFNVPAIEGTTYDQYSLYFPGKDLLTYMLVAEDGSGTLNTSEDYTIELDDGKYPIDLHTFDRDALIFDGHQFDRVGILLPDGMPYLMMTSLDHPNFGIWAAPHAPFVCLEPWMGRTDDHGYTGDLTEKENVNALPAGETFEKTYTITVF
ncbi:MAG: aldose 1-epimerase family protein [Clostridiales bacterium]|nr:aldose 1-epimerase family protein [Candidatus Blautia equi]